MQVNNRDGFHKFLTLLKEDLQNNPGEWENKTLDSFLEAMATYTKAIEHYYANNNIDINIDNSNPLWRVFADILLGAKIYE